MNRGPVPRERQLLRVPAAKPRQAAASLVLRRRETSTAKLLLRKNPQLRVCDGKKTNPPQNQHQSFSRIRSSS
jgi:hypothetical protein